MRDRNAWPAREEPRYVELDLRLQQLRHPRLDDYWFIRSAVNYFDQIRIPVLAMTSSAAAQALNLKQHAKLPASSRVHLSASGDQLQDPDILANELLPFCQWCFNGQDPAALARIPKLSVAVRNQQQLRNLAEWPAAALRFTPLYLHGSSEPGTPPGKLGTQPPDSGTRSELGEGTGLIALTFSSPVLAQDVELLGPLLLELHAISTATDTAFRVELLEEVTICQVTGAPGELPSFLNPDRSPTVEALTATTTTVVSSGQLKASARQLSV